MRNRFALAVMIGAFAYAVLTFVEAGAVIRSGPSLLLVSSILAQWLWKPLTLFASAVVIEMLARVTNALEQKPLQDGA